MKIKIKPMLMGIAATSAILGGMAFQSSSAEALDLKNGDNINIVGGLTLSQTAGGLFGLNFDAPAKQEVDGFSSTIPPFVEDDSVTFANLSGLTLGATFGPIVDFITGIDLDDGTGGTDTAKFNLTTGRLVQGGAANSFDLILNGDFLSSTNQKLGVGTLTSQLSHNGVLNPGGSVRTSLSSSLTVVPTPAAVLPALMGMGTAAFRKKKREGEDELALAGAEEA